LTNVENEQTTWQPILDKISKMDAETENLSGNLKKIQETIATISKSSENESIKIAKLNTKILHTEKKLAESKSFLESQKMLRILNEKLSEISVNLHTYKTLHIQIEQIKLDLISKKNKQTQKQQNLGKKTEQNIEIQKQISTQQRTSRI